MEEALEAFSNRLEKRFSAWGPAQYIEGFPEGQSPEMFIEPSFSQKSWRVTVSTPPIEAYSNSDMFLQHYWWSPRRGYVYDEIRILNYLILFLAEAAGLYDCYVKLSPSLEDRIYYSCVLHPSEDERPIIRRGYFDKEKVFHYKEVQALMDDFLS